MAAAGPTHTYTRAHARYSGEISDTGHVPPNCHKHIFLIRTRFWLTVFGVNIARGQMKYLLVDCIVIVVDDLHNKFNIPRVGTRKQKKILPPTGFPTVNKSNYCRIGISIVLYVYTPWKENRLLIISIT